MSLLAFLGIGTSSVPKLSSEQNSNDKDRNFVKPESIRGCYELGALNWKPDLELDKEEMVFITPPERIELLTEHGTQGFEKNGYLVRPAPGFPQTVHRSSYWVPTGPKRIEMVFTTGFSGLEMHLTVQGDTLQGKAKTFWDFLRRRQTARVVAHKVACASSQ